MKYLGNNKPTGDYPACVGFYLCIAICKKIGYTVAMPRKKIRKEKTREYLEGLLDRVGVTDRLMAESIKRGLASENAGLHTKALEMAGRWKGFNDVDKKVGEGIERLPISNLTLEDLDKLANRCAYCKLGKFEAKNKSVELSDANPAPLPSLVPELVEQPTPTPEPLNEQDTQETPN